MRTTTLLAIFFVPFPLIAETVDAKKQTIAFLESLQQPDGGFIAAPPEVKSGTAPKSSLRATSAAVRAIKYLGGEVPNADKALQFVKACYSPETGAFADTPKGKTDVTVTAVGMMAAAELQKEPGLDLSVVFLAKNAKTFEERRLAVAGMEAAKKFDPAIKEWFVEIEKTRNTDGTYGKGEGQARESGGVAAMVLRSGGMFSVDHRKAIVAALQAGQRSDGGFGKEESKTSDGETTYRVMRAFHLLGEKPKDVKKLSSFLASCRNKDGGYGPAPGQPSNVGGTYYVAAIGKWLAK